MSKPREEKEVEREKKEELENMAVLKVMAPSKCMHQKAVAMDLQRSLFSN